MSSLLGGGSGLAGLARVAFEATGVGETTRDIERVEQVYRSSTSEMSDSAIKVQLAQERLQRSLRKGPAAFQSQANAELALRRAERELRGETDATTRSLDRQQRELGQSARGAVAGSGAFRGLGRSLAFASAGFLGGAGLVYGMRQAISVASNLEEQTNKTRQVFDQSAQSVVDWGRTTSTSIGLANDQALAFVSTFGLLFRNIGQTAPEAAKLSQSLVELAADLASFNNTSVEDALNAIRSGLTGEIEPLRRYGVFLSEARTRADALNVTHKESAAQLTTNEKVLARYRLLFQDTTRAQGDFARTADGLANSQRTLSALWREAQGIVGQALAPAFTDVVQGLRDWLAEDKNRVQLQREVNSVVGDGVTVIRELASVLETGKDAAEPLVSAVGGIGNAVKIMTVAWVAFKVRSVLSFASTAGASALTSRKMVADAAIAGRAWDIATRHRVLTVTTAGGFVGSRGTVPGGGGFGRGALGLLGLTPGSAIVTGAALLTYFGIRSGQRDPISPETYAKMKRAARGGNISYAQVDQLAQFLTDAQERELRGLIAIGNARRSGAGAGPDSAGGPRGPGAIATQQAASRGAGADGTGAGRTLADIYLDQARASATAGTSDDLRLHREAANLLQRKIDNLERRKTLTEKQKEELRRLYGEIAREQSAIDGIVEEGEQKAQEARDKAKEKRREERERREAALRERIERREGRLTLAQELAGDTRKDLLDDKKALIALRRFYGEQAGNDKLTLKERQEFAAKRREVRRQLQALREQAIADAIDDEKITERERKILRQLGGADLVRQAQRALKKDKKDAKGLTAADVQRMQFNFLTSLTGEIAQWGSNFTPDAGGSGQLETNAHMQTQLLQQTNAALHRLIEGSWHPGAQMASAEMSAAGWGVGF